MMKQAPNQQGSQRTTTWVPPPPDVQAIRTRVRALLSEARKSNWPALKYEELYRLLFEPRHPQLKDLAIKFAKEAVNVTAPKRDDSALAAAMRNSYGVSPDELWPDRHIPVASGRKEEFERLYARYRLQEADSVDKLLSFFKEVPAVADLYPEMEPDARTFAHSLSLADARYRDITAAKLLGRAVEVERPLAKTRLWSRAPAANAATPTPGAYTHQR